MRRLFILGGAALAAAALHATTPDIQTELALARQQLAEFYLDAGAIPGVAEITVAAGSAATDARGFAGSLDATGAWTDIDYASKDQSAWPPSIHYGRMLALAITRLRDSTPPDERAILTEALHRAFSHWIAHDYQCPNWWFNQIGAPKQFGVIAVLLGDDLRPAERSYLVGTMLPRARIGMTGQNRVWLAGNTLTRGLLAGDPGLVDECTRVIWEELSLTTGEGIQPDFSFQQHGPQQQFGNYGLGLAIEIARWATALRNTRWSLPPEALVNYRHFLLDGESWTLWHGLMDISACGRHLFPGSPAAKAATLLNVTRHATSFDPAAAADYDALARRQPTSAVNDLTGLRVFWRSDYLIQRRPKHGVTLKMSSNRVIGAESLNNENFLGYHLGDGATYFYREGNEYTDLFPVWDWRKLPGVTCPQTPGELPRFRNYRIGGNFTGGVTDGTQGLAVLEYIRDGVTARKAWFFAEEETVMLGQGITATDTPALGTTINQCRLRGPVLIKRANQPAKEQAPGRTKLTDVEWIEHDGWRYTFPWAQSVQLELKTQRGHWSRVYQNPTTPAAEIAMEVFTLWIDHGAHAKDAGYACIVGPAGREAAARVLINRSGLQVVTLDRGKIGFAFWQAGEARLAGLPMLAVNAPALLVLDSHDSRLTVAEPTQKLASLQVIMDGVRLTVALPREGNAGRSLEVTQPAR